MIDFDKYSRIICNIILIQTPPRSCGRGGDNFTELVLPLRAVRG
jgi:hypothetical protein